MNRKLISFGAGFVNIHTFQRANHRHFPNGKGLEYFDAPQRKSDRGQP
jgi:hypothetical protein